MTSVEMFQNVKLLEPTKRVCKRGNPIMITGEVQKGKYHMQVDCDFCEGSTAKTGIINRDMGTVFIKCGDELSQTEG